LNILYQGVTRGIYPPLIFLGIGAMPLLGMLFFGNILKESGVTRRQADTAKTSLIDIVTIVLGAVSFMIATASGDIDELSVMSGIGCWLFGVGVIIS